MSGSKRINQQQMLLAAGVSLVSVVVGGYLLITRKSRTTSSATPSTTSSSAHPQVAVEASNKGGREQEPSVGAVIDTSDLSRRPSFLDAARKAVDHLECPPPTQLVEDESVVVGHAKDSPIDVDIPIPLARLPPLKIVPSLKLLKENTEVKAACGLVSDAALTSASDSSGERSTPRDAIKHNERIRKKLMHVSDLLARVATCLEKERNKCLTKMHHAAGSSVGGWDWLEEIRRLETSMETLSLRSLVGVSRSTTLTTRLCSVLAVEDNEATNLASKKSFSHPCTKHEGSKEAIDHDEEMTLAKTKGSLHPVADHLTSFGAFLFAKEMIAQGQLGAQTKRLLFHAIDQLRPLSETHLHRVINNPKENALTASVVFPLDKECAVHEPWLWYLLGQVLEVHDGSVDVMASNSAIFELPDAVRVAQRYFDVSYLPPYVAAYVMALVTSAGNLGAAWMGLALALNGDDTVSLFGQTFTAVECLPQAIRCNGGSKHCSSFAVWTEAAALLEFASLSATGNGNPNLSRSTGATISVTTAAHAPFIPNGHAPADARETLSRLDCLVKAAALPEAAGDAALWLQLGMLLNFGKHVSDHVLVIEEEMVDVGGMRVGRFDCYALSAAIDATSAVLWYRIAVSLEDKPQMLAAVANGTYVDVDAKAYERHLFGSALPPIDRETALLKSLKEDPSDSKVWFVLATTLFERNGQLVQPEALRLKIPRSLCVLRRQRSMERVSSQSSPRDTRSPVSEDLADDEIVLVSAEDLFKRCVQTKPSLEPTVQKWIVKNQGR
jgi:hypothetical protein